MVIINIQYLYRYYTIPYILCHPRDHARILYIGYAFHNISKLSRLAMAPENSLIIYKGFSELQTGCVSLENLS